MNQLNSENLKHRRIELCMAIRAHESGRTILKLENQVQYWQMKYPSKNAFNMSQIDIRIKEYINSLKDEIKDEKEFLNGYISNKTTNTTAEGISQESDTRLGNTARVFTWS